VFRTTRATIRMRGEENHAAGIPQPERRDHARSRPRGTFVVTRNGVPVGELMPLRQRRFVAAGTAVAAFADAPAIERERFRADVDAPLDQNAPPRA